MKRLGMPVTQILMVDDFLPWLHFVSEMLQSESDLQVISVASDGLEAVQKAKEVQPDLMLMDLSLPEMNGIEAAHVIRIVCPGSKVLFLSEHHDSGVIP
jgi:two-component system nitrate/nitrite response regulator NarL